MSVSLLKARLKEKANVTCSDNQLNYLIPKVFNLIRYNIKTHGHACLKDNVTLKYVDGRRLRRQTRLAYDHCNMPISYNDQEIRDFCHKHLHSMETYEIRRNMTYILAEINEMICDVLYTNTDSLMFKKMFTVHKPNGNLIIRITDSFEDWLKL